MSDAAAIAAQVVDIQNDRQHKRTRLPNGLSAGERIIRRSMPVPFSGCWIWTAGTNKKGYGWMMMEGKPCLAHRASYEAFVGLIPADICVLHKCDIPACVNPDHLFLGTYADNNADRDAKGRGRIGETHHCAKLSDAHIREIRASGLSHYALAKRFNVSREHIRNIRNFELRNTA